MQAESAPVHAGVLLEQGSGGLNQTLEIATHQGVVPDGMPKRLPCLVRLPEVGAIEEIHTFEIVGA